MSVNKNKKIEHNDKRITEALLQLQSNLAETTDIQQLNENNFNEFLQSAIAMAEIYLLLNPAASSDEIANGIAIALFSSIDLENNKKYNSRLQ